MNRIIVVLLLVLASYAELFSQSGSSARAIITGRVADGSTGEPMAAATVSITDRETGKVVAGTITNMNGEFQIPGIPFGQYNVGISFVGYKEATIDSMALGDNEPEVSLGTIRLTPADVTLSEVTVTGEKPVIENRSDKIVYNVSSDITSQGTLAIDVLRKVPQVTVDAEGNVELQGNSNIRFLINGKELSIFGNNVADALASIPASQIKTIEAVTNPGAKYDLQGTGGVINIILQENRLQGFSGNINLTAGTRNQNGSVNIGIKKGNFGINGYFSGNWRLGTDGSFSSVRSTSDTVSGVSTILEQNGINRFERNGYRAGAGFEWDISKKSNLTGTAGYNFFSFGSSGLVDIDEKIFDINGATESEMHTIRDFSTAREIRSLDWNLHFKNKFEKEGHELDIVVNSSYGRPVSDYSLTLSRIGDINPIQGSESKNKGTDNTTTLSADYVYPFNSTSEFEAGLKGSFNRITSPVRMSVFDPSSGEYLFDQMQSYDLGYNLGIYAAYASAGFRLFNWLDLKTGARYEYSDVKIDYPGTSVPSYGTLVPSILLSHNFNEKRSVQLSYSRRIRRPDYNDLNPFINRSDPYNIQTGNVLLKPEVGERFELSYNTGFSTGGNLRLTLSQGIDSREIEEITVFHPEYAIGDSVFRNVSVTTRENIGSEYTTGLSIFGSVPVTSKLSIRGNLMMFYSSYETLQSTGLISTGFRFRGNLNASWQLPHKFLIEAFGFWRSGGKGIQGREPQFYIYNLALRKLFWKDKGSIGFTATNFMAKSIRQVSTITTVNSNTRSVRELPFRSFGLSFTYKFGKMQSRPDRDRENDTDSFGDSPNQ